MLYRFLYDQIGHIDNRLIIKIPVPIVHGRHNTMAYKDTSKYIYK